MVKVEVWDVVDKGRRKAIVDGSTPSSNGTKDKLKMSNTATTANGTSNGTSKSSQAEVESSTPVLDAEFVNVYSGTHGVIFMFDMTKSWTWEYVQREVRQVPGTIPILILANHRDMGHHRVVSADQVQSFIDSLANECRVGQIRHAEASMRNGFGLRYLYKFFNLPYLHLQRETLRRQLERNQSEMIASCQELDLVVQTDEYNYDLFLDMITKRRREAADQMSGKVNGLDSGTVPIPVASPAQQQAIMAKSVSMPTNIASAASGLQRLVNGSNGVDQLNGTSEPKISKPSPSIIIGAKHPLPQRFQAQLANATKTTKTTTSSSPKSVKNIHDFNPDDHEEATMNGAVDGSFRRFLDEPNQPLDMDDLGPVQELDSDDETSEADGARLNPMVAKYQEDLDPEDLQAWLEDGSVPNGAMIKQEEVVASTLEGEDEGDSRLTKNNEDLGESDHDKVHVDHHVQLYPILEQDVDDDVVQTSTPIKPGYDTLPETVSVKTSKSKKKSSKITENSSSSSSSSSTTVDNTKSRKSTLKTSNKKKKKVTESVEDENQEEREKRQLEDFLGGPSQSFQLKQDYQDIWWNFELNRN